MSFTAEVVAELAPHVPLLRCCRAALLDGMRAASGGDTEGAVLTTVRPAAARLALAVLHADRHPVRLARLATARRPRYALVGEVLPGSASDRQCCARALLRGALLVGGAVSRPDAAPHLELAARDAAGERLLLDALQRLHVAGVAVTRHGRRYVVVRSVEGVAAVLSDVGAQGARLRFEEGRVVREVRATVNRRLNGETGNLRRVVEAAHRQAAAAAALQGDGVRWAATPPALREAALLRHRHPADSLAALAARAGTSRSAMAGRLHRLVELAERGAGVRATSRGHRREVSERSGVAAGG